MIKNEKITKNVAILAEYASMDVKMDMRESYAKTCYIVLMRLRQFMIVLQVQFIIYSIMC